MAEKKGAGGKPQKYDEKNGEYSFDGFGNARVATPAEARRMVELGIDEEYQKQVNARMKWTNEHGVELPLNAGGSLNGIKLQELKSTLPEKQEKSEVPIVSDLKDEWSNDLQPRGHLKFSVEDEKLYDYVKNDLGISLQEAEEYVDSVLEYTDNNYKKIRAYQNGEIVEDESKIKKIADNIERYIKKAHRWNGGETTRGISLSKDELDKYVPGYEFTGMKGSASWSSNFRTARDFALRNSNNYGGKAVVFHSDTQNKGTSVTHLSMLGGMEKEVLVSKDARYRVLDKKDDGEIIHVYLKEL